MEREGEEKSYTLHTVGSTSIYACMHSSKTDKNSTTPSVSNYKSFQKSWRVKSSQSLTKIIERNTKIYDIKYVHYENIANKKSNNT